MTDFKKVFIDTAPIIYYLQKSELYYTNMKEFWEKYNEYDYVTSAITVTEYLTYPYKQEDMTLVDLFYAFMNEMDIQVKSIDERIAEKAAQIRAEYKFFKAVDALQLATACIMECDLFLTNDKQLRQFKEIKCITVDELE
ncbi:MAG: PIN domain-containing protein [Lachnospiraceae bacterium]|nr:PIN domain-containing protein [Lachnospiraceae bacterium]